MPHSLIVGKYMRLTELTIVWVTDRKGDRAVVYALFSVMALLKTTNIIFFKTALVLISWSSSSSLSS